MERRELQRHWRRRSISEPHMSFFWKNWTIGDSIRLAILAASVGVAVYVWVFLSPETEIDPNHIKITTGGNFQEILPSAATRHSLIIQNTNTNPDPKRDEPRDNCWIFLGDADPTTTNSILLMPGGSFTRYYPSTPSDQVLGTCARAGNTMYVKAE
jgi:hypothetical protein